MEEAMRDQGVENSLRGSQKKKRFALLLIIIGLILLAIFGAYYFLSSRKAEKPTVASSVPTVTTTETPTETPTATPSVSSSPTPTTKTTPTTSAALNRANLSIDVQNGSGAPGVGSKTAAFLKGLGYTIASTDNADAFTYTGVTIHVKPAKADYLAQLQKDMSASYTITSADAKLASSSADAVVIVGR